MAFIRNMSTLMGSIGRAGTIKIVLFASIK